MYLFGNVHTTHKNLTNIQVELSQHDMQSPTAHVLRVKRAVVGASDGKYPFCGEEELVSVWFESSLTKLWVGVSTSGTP